MRKKIILAISMSISIAALITAIFFLAKALIDKNRENTPEKDENITISGKDGVTPHIGENGNWWLGLSDTGIKAEGKDGKDGQDGANGQPGRDGIDGKDGISPHIGKNGNWWIGSSDTGIAAEGKDGNDGASGKDGLNGSNGKDGIDGKDGDTPYIKNGTWWIGEINTGVLAEGKNGKDGKDGKNGENGSDGDTPFIKDGVWWIGTTDTGVTAVGKDGENGKNGENGSTPYIFGGTWWIDGQDTGVIAEGKNGINGTDGNGIVDVKIEDGYLYLMFSDSEGIWKNIGKIVQDVYVDGDGTELDYYILPDGTYGVKAGKQLYSDMITIPEKHLGKTVSTILPDAFSGAINLESIEIPTFITQIGDNAFAGCKRLSSIKIPESVSTLGRNVFLNCENLTIYAEADSALVGWDSDYNPDSRPVIFNCSSDVKITADGLRYKVTGENEVSILGYVGSSYKVVIPEEIEGKHVTDIAENAFAGNGEILSVTIPKTMATIGNGAFKNCYRLVEVYNFTDMDIKLGDSGFGAISEYAKAIHKSNTEDSIIKDFTSDFVFINVESKYHLVYYTGNEKSINLPESCNGSSYVINDYALYGMSNIESITITENVAAIGAYSFAECRNVTSLYFGASNLTMLKNESNAFLGLGRNSSGVSLTIGKNVYGIPAKLFETNIENVENSPKITDVSFEAGAVCKSIGASAFMNVNSLMDIAVPGTVERIEAKAFSGCSSLVSVKADGLFFANNTYPVYFNNDFEANANYLTDDYVNMELKRQ